MAESKKTLNRKVADGLLWGILERGGMQGINFFIQLVLARLLCPDDYGVLAILNVFISLSTAFVNNGLGNALIQKKDSDELDFNSVFYVQLGLAVFFVIALFFAAPFVSAWYDNSFLTAYLRVMSLVLIVDAIYAIQNTALVRSLQFRKLFYANIMGVLVQGASGITAAYCGMGVWSLIISQLSQKLMVLLVLIATVRWKPKLMFSWKRVKELFRYSWKLFVGWIIGTIHQDIYALVVGKFFNITTLGYYNRGQSLPQTITKTVTDVASRVMFPALASIQDNGKAYRVYVKKMMMVMSFVIWPVCAGLAAVSHSLILLLLTEKWAPSIPMMQLFMISYGFNIMSTTNMQAFNAMGRSDIFLKMEAIKRSLSILLLISACLLFRNIYAAIIVVDIMGLFSFCYNVHMNKKLLDYKFWEQMTDMLPSMLISLAMFFATWQLERLGFSNVITLVIQMVFGIMFYICVNMLLQTPCIKITMELVKNRKQK